MEKKTRLLVMGKLYFKNKDYKLAENSFIEYLNSTPEDFQALKLLAQTYEFQRDFSKAFDAYERCYLAEPERKGVLLDICRLLLMNDSSLDHIDAKKWLKLAIQCFPSNPIVVNLKQSLPVADQTPNKTSIEGEILDKLIAMERRLEQIETKISNLSLNNHPAPAQPERPEPIFASSQPMKQSSLFSLENSPFSSEKNQLPIEKTPVSAEKILAPVEKSAVSTEKTQVLVEKPPVSIVKAPVSAAKSQAPAEKTPVSATKPLSAVKPPAPTEKVQSLFGNTQWSLDKTAAQPKPLEASIFKPEPMPSLFNFSNPSSGNLFADSLKKFNIETSLPSFGAPVETKKECEAEEDDDAPVKTEELPIEDTCDMKPIEIKSGEEDEDILFQERCKLFRFRDKEYKERGLGDMKVLKHRETGKGRLIMRRELINLVCLNCWSFSKIERVRDNQVRFAGLDASDGQPDMTVFLAKFRTADMTDRFEALLREHMDE